MANIFWGKISCVCIWRNWEGKCCYFLFPATFSQQLLVTDKRCVQTSVVRREREGGGASFPQERRNTIRWVVGWVTPLHPLISEVQMRDTREEEEEEEEEEEGLSRRKETFLMVGGATKTAIYKETRVWAKSCFHVNATCIPNHQRWYAKGKVSWNILCNTVHTHFCTFGANLHA